MQNIKTKIIYILRLIWAAWPLILISLLLLNYHIDSCYDVEHGVWDYKQFSCRKDCLKWTWRDGCIPLEED